MDSDRDTFLNIFSRRIVAAVRPGQRWEITIDGEPHPHSGEDCSPVKTLPQTLKGFDDTSDEHVQQWQQLKEQRYKTDNAGSIIAKSPDLASAYPPLSSSSAIVFLAPVLEFASAAAAASASRGLENFDDANCAICMCGLFESGGEGSVAIDSREMNCPGRHTFHSQCAKTWFTGERWQKRHIICPFCRHDFSESVREYCATNLEHQVQPCPNSRFSFVWSKRCDQRLIALIAIVQLPSEAPIGESVASALMWSCLDDAADNANAALCSGRLSAAFEVMPQVLVGPWCANLVNLFNVAETDSIRSSFLTAICDVSKSEEGCAALVSAGAFNALINALKIAEICHDTAEEIAFAVSSLVQDEEPNSALICHLLEELSAAKTDDWRGNFVAAVESIAENVEGALALISAGACSVLLEVLKDAHDEYVKSNICMAMTQLAYIEEGMLALVDAGACEILVAALSSTGLYASSDENTRVGIIFLIMQIAKRRSCLLAIIAAGACSALIAALKHAETIIWDYGRYEQMNYIAESLSYFAEIKDGRVALIEAGACAVLVTFLNTCVSNQQAEHIHIAMTRLSLCKRGRVGLIAALVDAVKNAVDDDERGNLLFAIQHLARHRSNRLALISAGACGALVQAFKFAEARDIRCAVVDTMRMLVNHGEGVAAFVAAGMCSASAEALKQDFDNSTLADLCSLPEFDIAKFSSFLAGNAEGGSALVSSDDMCPPAKSVAVDDDRPAKKCMSQPPITQFFHWLQAADAEMAENTQTSATVSAAAEGPTSAFECRGYMTQGGDHVLS